MQEINLSFRNSVGKFSARNGYSFFQNVNILATIQFFNYFMQNPWVVMYPHIFNNFLVGHKFQAILVDSSGFPYVKSIAVNAQKRGRFFDPTRLFCVKNQDCSECVPFQT
jgi:hypothetical protein